MDNDEIFGVETAVSPTNSVAKYQRTTYALGGQTVAVRVVAFDASGDEMPTAPDTGLFYLLTDHPRLREDRVLAAWCRRWTAAAHRWAT